MDSAHNTAPKETAVSVVGPRRSRLSPWWLLSYPGGECDKHIADRVFLLLLSLSFCLIKVIALANVSPAQEGTGTHNGSTLPKVQLQHRLVHHDRVEGTNTTTVAADNDNDEDEDEVDGNENDDDNSGRSPNAGL